jgi:DNA-binding HxlR family transcriptional regulator
MTRKAVKGSCVEPALSVLDNRWTVLLLREAFHGARRFGQFARALGIARTVLASRLDRLVADELLERHLYDAERGWYEYRLTQKGLDLFPAIIALTQWGERYSTGDAVEFRHRGCGPVAPLQPHCSKCGEPLVVRDVEPVTIAPEP